MEVPPVDGFPFLRRQQARGLLHIDRGVDVVRRTDVPRPVPETHRDVLGGIPILVPLLGPIVRDGPNPAWKSPRIPQGLHPDAGVQRGRMEEIAENADVKSGGTDKPSTWDSSRETIWVMKTFLV